MNEDVLEHCVEQALISSLDLQLVRYLSELSGERRPEALLAVALTSRYSREGHVCVDLARAAGTQVPSEDEDHDALSWPPLSVLLPVLSSSPLVGRKESNTPLVLEGNRLYLRRHFDHEAAVTRAILERLRRATEMPAALPAGVMNILDRLFGRTSSDEPDWQRFAVQLALIEPFLIISGGPGTGKTSTVVRLMALLVELAFAEGRRPPRVLLLAPTGKATLRLMESMRTARGSIDCSPEVRDALPVEASTIHRALVPRRDGSPGFEHGPERPLLADVVLVDEVSMVDVALMRRLLDAVPANARVILLGDRHQLASVEAGAVLADLCGHSPHPGYSSELGRRFRDAFSELPPNVATQPIAPIADCIVELKRSHRFASDSGIAALARAIQAGDADEVIELLGQGRTDLQWQTAHDPEAASEALRSAVVAGYRPFCERVDPERALGALGHFRILCAHRRGPFGVEGMNRLVERLLAGAGLLRRGGGPSYSHQPVLVLHNDYGLGLFNGDVGVVLPDGGPSGQLVTHFMMPDGRLRRLPVSRLPAHETVFAMSIHKSQGSEFDDVAIVLPDARSPLLSRELLYTAVTRARRRVRVVASVESIRAAVTRRVERASGLADALWD